MAEGTTRRGEPRKKWTDAVYELLRLDISTENAKGSHAISHFACDDVNGSVCFSCIQLIA